VLQTAFEAKEVERAVGFTRRISGERRYVTGDNIMMMIMMI